MTATQHDRMPTVAGVCVDDAEVLALSVARFVAAGYMTSDAACWDAGHACAEEVLGLADGPRLVATMATIVRALRAERQEPWRFMPATCCRVTPDESELIGSLGVARRRDRHALAAAAAMIANRPAAPRLAAALEVAAEMLDTIQGRLEGGHRATKRDALH